MRVPNVAGARMNAIATAEELNAANPLRNGGTRHAPVSWRPTQYVSPSVRRMETLVKATAGAVAGSTSDMIGYTEHCDTVGAETESDVTEF
jgi:hypothetical protein